MTYEELLIEAEELGIIVKECSMKTKDGQCYGNRIAINKNLSNIEKACVLAEELGHYHLTVGDILEQEDNSENYKQELLARRWGYEKNVGVLGILNAFNNGCRTRYEVADYLDVTIDYLNEAIEYFSQKYWNGCQIDNYYLTFDNGIQITKAVY